ncbi:MAG: hypothetical protein NZM94_05580, partial [Roseiflexus sp.]|nr:hypothetical protein [Roseiflexus sp.]
MKHLVDAFYELMLAVSEVNERIIAFQTNTWQNALAVHFRCVKRIFESVLLANFFHNLVVKREVVSRFAKFKKFRQSFLLFPNWHRLKWSWRPRFLGSVGVGERHRLSRNALDLGALVRRRRLWLKRYFRRDLRFFMRLSKCVVLAFVAIALAPKSLAQ